MSRNKALAVLQKTYDESYLSCSTAVYHESQGNELEAMRHWKSALENIYDYNANKALPAHSPRTDTEKALTDALKQLELQCKERIDLLEALRASRQEETASGSSRKLSKEIEAYEANSSRSRGSIGQGTIPAVTYSELSRPSLPPRPSPTTRKSSEAPTPNSIYASRSGNALSNNASRSSLLERARDQGDENSLRSPSPDKHTMRTTLRSGKLGEKSSKTSRKVLRPPGEGSSKAATLAWSSLGYREKPSRSSSSAVQSEVKPSSQRLSSEQPRPAGASPLQWDSHSRRLVNGREYSTTINDCDSSNRTRHSDEHPEARPSLLSVSAASSALTSSATQEVSSTDQSVGRSDRHSGARAAAQSSTLSPASTKPEQQSNATNGSEPKKESLTVPVHKKAVVSGPRTNARLSRLSNDRGGQVLQRERNRKPQARNLSSSEDETVATTPQQRRSELEPVDHAGDSSAEPSDEPTEDEAKKEDSSWSKRKANILKNLPPGVDEGAAKQILNDIVVQGDVVHWSDIAGLEVAKNALREAVVYPFLRPDLFMGLREPARGMLLFGPPGTGKTMLARAVATESRSTFFSISASSLTSKFLGESEKLVRALFGLARLLAPSIIFVDEIDSLLSQRSSSGEHEATRRIKTEFLIQWSDLQRAAAGREVSARDQERGDANRVLVLAATNLPWAIDEAARRRFVRRQYIPLPESTTRETQLRTLLGQQNHGLTDVDIQRLVELTDGFSGSDITALAKDAAMGPLRSLGEALLHMTMEDIRPIMLLDFEISLGAIRPSVSKAGLKEYEDWAKEFGERGG